MRRAITSPSLKWKPRTKSSTFESQRRAGELTKGFSSFSWIERTSKPRMRPSAPTRTLRFSVASRSS